MMPGTPDITIYEGKTYLVHCAGRWPDDDYPGWYREVDGKDVIPLCKEIYDDRRVTDIRIYEMESVPVDSPISDDVNQRYCISHAWRGKLHYQVMLADFVDMFVAKYSRDDRAASLRLFKVKEIARDRNNWFFRDFSKAIEMMGHGIVKKARS